MPNDNLLKKGLVRGKVPLLFIILISTKRREVFLVTNESHFFQ